MKTFPVKTISAILLFLFCGAWVMQAQEQAQTPAPAQGQRWLLVFGTSSAMKKRLPAVEAGIKTLFDTGFDGKISEGDNIRVWTVGDKLKVGPRTEWSSENTPGLTTNLIGFLHAQSFSGSANLSGLQSDVQWVVANSDKVTILIYCDGSEQIDWSPYDGINDTLRRTAAERKISKEPVLVMLRAQQGKFIAGMVNFPPVPLRLPLFPALPGEVKSAVAAADIASNLPPAVAASAPPKPAAAAVASLIIVGTHISTNAADATNIEPVVSVPVPVAPVPKSNVPMALVTPVAPVIVKTNPPPVVTNPVPAIVQTPVKDTNQPVAALTADDHIEKILTYGGIGLLIVAAGLVIFLLRWKSSPRGSLISSSMQDNFRSKDQK